jgi:hypothetical protein
LELELEIAELCFGIGTCYGFTTGLGLRNYWHLAVQLEQQKNVDIGSSSR